MKPALVVLAAGASRRLGTCKALVDLGGRTPLERLCTAGACFDELPPLVVAGAHRDAIARGLPPGVELVFHPGWAAGRSGSVACAARARPGRDLVLAPVDVPLVPAAVFEQLLEAWTALGCPPRGWLAPARTADGTRRFGHPVVVGRELFSELGAPDAPLRELRARADPLQFVEVSAEEVLDDLDRPPDLERLQRRLHPS